MKLPNGFGTVYKLNGSRRKAYRVVVCQGYTYHEDGVKLRRETLGYYSTKKEALEALTSFNENPYDIKTDSITFKEVYAKWSIEHFQTLNNKSAIRTYNAAFKHSLPLHEMRFKDIKARHLEGTIGNANVGDATKARMKSMYNLIFRYAIKHDIVEKNYAELCNTVKVEKKNIKIPFTTEEVNKIWEKVEEIPFADMILIGIYSGFRPIELVSLKNKDIHFDEGYFVGGAKTEAGRDRIVPIHPKIELLVRKRYSDENEYLFNDYNKMTGEIACLTYDKYRGRFNKVMKALGLKHNPHETRHTFITQAKLCDVNEYILKKIIGHEIADITESVYTHRSIETYREEIAKIKF